VEPKERGLRVLLGLQAVVSMAIGVWGVLWEQMLSNVLGLKIPDDAAGLARLFGVVMLVIAVAYALAAAQPHRSRAFLVPLFLVPLALGIGMIANVARGDVAHSFRAIVFCVYCLAYCLLYFRVYPRVEDAAPPKT
jgi:hypothetical protein